MVSYRSNTEQETQNISPKRATNVKFLIPWLLLLLFCHLTRECWSRKKTSTSWHYKMLLLDCPGGNVTKSAMTDAAKKSAMFAKDWNALNFVYISYMDFDSFCLLRDFFFTAARFVVTLWSKKVKQEQKSIAVGCVPTAEITSNPRGGMVYSPKDTPPSLIRYPQIPYPPIPYPLGYPTPWKGHGTRDALTPLLPLPVDRQTPVKTYTFPQLGFAVDNNQEKVHSGVEIVYLLGWSLSFNSIGMWKLWVWKSFNDHFNEFACTVWLEWSLSTPWRK